jgi:ammonium transporter, Amt family
LCAAIGAIVVGPRGGKYNQDGSTNLIPGHSFPMMAAGTFFIMLGILAELAGGADSLSQGEAICNGLLAAAAAGLVAMIYGHYRYGITDVHLAVIGLLGGIVSVSAGAQDMPACAAAIIGAVAGFLVPWAVVQIDLKHKIDDPASSIGTYAVAGAWGMLAAGIFAPGTLMARLHQILIQLAALVAVATLSLIVLGMTWLIMRAVMPLRLGEADELDGGDLAELDVNAYPDFQQTTIKSYHLRET